MSTYIHDYDTVIEISILNLRNNHRLYIFNIRNYDNAVHFRNDSYMNLAQIFENEFIIISDLIVIMI